MTFKEWLREICGKSNSLAKFYAQHYLVLSATAFFVFTGLCYIYTSVYFSNFGIDFYYFGSLRDVYQAALTGHILQFLFFLLVIAHSILIVISRENKALTNKSNRFAIMQLICVVLGVIGGVLFPILYFQSGTKAEALNIKEGFSAHYTFHTETSQMNCLPIIASTGNYIVFWDRQLEQAHIISRSSVVKFDLVMESPPNKYLLPRSRGSSPTEAQLNELIGKQQRWSEKLKTKCGFTVEWPKHKPIEPSLFDKIWRYISKIFKD